MRRTEGINTENLRSSIHASDDDLEKRAPQD
jgi:hypothetical protein